MVDGHGVASVGMMDVVMARAQNLEPWIRVAINKPLIKYLPMWMTANLITLIDFFVVVAFTVAAIMSQQVDSAVLSYALKVSVGLMFILFALLDVLVRASASVRTPTPQTQRHVPLPGRSAFSL